MTTGESLNELHAIRDLDQLDDLLSTPTPGVVETFSRLDGDLILLGVAGKMGPTLALMARRAFDAAGLSGRRVIGVARFSTAGSESWLQGRGIETIRADLLEPGALERLPEAANVVSMFAMKFGATGQEARTWAMNAYLPGLVAARYRGSRIVAFSTGNVYGLEPITGKGSKESDPPRPVGEYGMSCLGRERILEHQSRALGIPMAVIRLNYAVEMRYGVLVDLGRKVFAGDPVDLAMGHFNAIWQGDANAMTLRAFDHAASPPAIFNVTGPDVLSVRRVAERLGERLGRPPRFLGAEAPDALLSDAGRAIELFGPPRIDTDRLIDLTADWLLRGGATLGKPTHFQARDGRF
ncbi:NAD-dependent epimerase/dehydratase family protein [Aquisphaera insulae]|uniref:NAD-dependent epimerase/dehydratase family protein n=1 Tax=Aquisphaera insulae TaxID=2712864 RepID=UPI0013EC34C3|nr:NAD-dependent epimerase/dehydratase family protein [Aquisphaera insulae]